MKQDEKGKCNTISNDLYRRNCMGCHLLVIYSAKCQFVKSVKFRYDNTDILRNWTLLKFSVDMIRLRILRLKLLLWQQS